MEFRRYARKRAATGALRHADREQSFRMRTARRIVSICMSTCLGHVLLESGCARGNPDRKDDVTARM